MYKFVGSNSDGLPLKRKQSQWACETCRKRKVRIFLPKYPATFSHDRNAVYIGKVQKRAKFPMRPVGRPLRLQQSTHHHYQRQMPE
jgi:hypothetical protein